MKENNRVLFVVSFWSSKTQDHQFASTPPGHSKPETSIASTTAIAKL